MAATFFLRLQCLEMNDGRRSCWSVMEMFDDSSSSVSALKPPARHSGWIHPADWSFSFRGSRLRSDSYQTSRQLRLSDRLHHRCPPALMGVSLQRVALSGPLAAVIIADVFLPSISFPQSRQSAARRCHMRQVWSERSTQTLSGLIWCSVAAQEMETVHLTGWSVRRWRLFSHCRQHLKLTPDKYLWPQTLST